MAKKKPDNLLAEMITPLAMRYAGHKVQRLLGYWVLVQTKGGWEAVAESEGYASSSVARQRKEFREVFGVEAEDWFPERGAALRSDWPGTKDVDA